MSDYVVLRMCVACRTMHPQNELIRLVNNNGTAVMDKNKKMFGRGAYICPSEKCIKIAKKKNILARHLKCVVGEEIYTMAEEML